ncbi:O-methyltransferase 1, chloroplastic isoform X1 [Macadamia integrifolia]|uniref:O-methyltransferase 1, chloroplastic isoform X1 n=1 Tax=Macadamia integrifolia TaxID=60698 RepID=UPI001C4E3E21|nr:O-methyltransferase 1, chloroplastic isoform X1 [Macadamia integrifolia]
MRTGWSRFPIHDSQALRLDLALQMRCLCLFPAAAVILVRPQLSRFSAKKRHGRLTAQLRNHDDPLLQAAIDAASLRFEETCKPEPLFLDPYAGCFIGSDTNEDMKLSPSFSASLHHYCLATKFIDDKLLSTINLMEGLRQIVLLADGMDTRPYRLNWPNSTIIFDISPDLVFQIAAQRLEGVGAKIPRNCLFVHVPYKCLDVQEILQRKGFMGSQPSFWIFQGLPVLNLASFNELLFIISCLATKGSLLVGELPIWLTETEVGNKSTTQKWMDKLFLSNGFQVEIIDFKDVARSVGRNPPLGGYKNILFVAEQLRLSDDQMESWRREYHRIEEEADEEGFEEI